MRLEDLRVQLMSQRGKPRYRKATVADLVEVLRKEGGFETPLYLTGRETGRYLVYGPIPVEVED